MSTQQIQDVREALVRTQPEGIDAQAAAAVEAAEIKPTAKGADVVWFILVGGLILLLAVAICGLIFADKDDKMITVVTTLLAGLLGLFVRSPVEKTGQ